MRMQAMIRSLILLSALILAACGSPGSSGNEKVVAEVNGAAITAAELQQAVAGYGKNNSVTRHTVDDQLKVMIEKKLLIREAVKLGLTEDPKFAETIKTFWEQTIIRNLIETKSRELSSRIFVTDLEITGEYERLHYRPMMRAVRGVRTVQDADKIAAEMRLGKRITNEEVIGPLFYDDAKGSPLAAAFDLKEGEVNTFVADGEYIVVGILNRESIPVPPLKDIEKRIRESLLEQKRQKALAEWIASVKTSSQVQINEKELRGIAHD
jgi:hypothetical protein